MNIVKKGTHLFRLYLNKVLWITPPHHTVIGCGDLVIHPMLYDFQLTPQKEAALFCGIRMMYVAKNTVPSVSGKTDAVALLNDGSILFYGTANTSLIESRVANFEIDENCERDFKMFLTSANNIGTNIKNYSTIQFSSGTVHQSPKQLAFRQGNGPHCTRDSSTCH